MGRFALALLTLISLIGCSQPASVEVRDVWARDTVGGTASAAVFMTVSSVTADRLVSASSPVAGKTRLMTMQGSGDTMAMVDLSAIDIPADTPVNLGPGGLHVWLDDLHKPLKAGETFPLTLKFEKAGEVQVAVSVIAPAAAAPMAGMEM